MLAKIFLGSRTIIIPRSFTKLLWMMASYVARLWSEASLQSDLYPNTTVLGIRPEFRISAAYLFLWYR